MQTGENKTLNQAPLELFRLWYSVGTLLLLTVAVVSLMPVPDVGVGDKLSHLVAYFILAGWFSLLAASRAALGWIIVGLIAYGILIEFLQGMTGYRYAEWRDVFANAIGTVSGVLLYFSPLRRLLRFIDGQLASLILR